MFSMTTCRFWMSRCPLLGVLAWALLSISLISPLRAQTTTATVVGTVTDSTKAAIVGAVVKVEGKDLTATRSVATDSHGAYHLAALAAGDYKLTVTRDGFETEVVENLVLTLDRTSTVNVTLKVGSAAEQVDVSSEGPMIDTTTPAEGMTITPEQIHDIPLNGRDYLSLLQMVPGVTVNSQSDPGSDTAVSVLGERGNNTGYLIDGLNNTNQVSGGASAQFNLDTISEFEVITAGYKAEFGHASGGVVNVITRSGANAYHGLASAYLRNNALDTSDIPGTSVPYLLRWDYDAALGGAIKKDKVFWFGSAEHIHENQQLNFTIPAAAPAPLVASETEYGSPSTDREVRAFGKITELWGKQTLAEEVNYTNAHIGNYNPLSASTELPSTRTNGGAVALMIGATDTVLLGKANSPWILNAYAQFRNEPGSTSPAHPSAGPLTLWNEFSSLTTGEVFGDLGQVEFGAENTPSYLLQKYGDSGIALTKTWKKNTIKFGYDYLRTQVDGQEASTLFNQLFATVSDFATYGPVNSGVYLLYSEGGLTPAAGHIQLRNNYSGAYVQDDYKLFHNVNVNAGLRWDYDSAFKIKKNFSPRVGFSWALNDKTAIRGSFGVFFDKFRLGLARDIPAFGGANLEEIQPFSYPRLFYGSPSIAPALFGLCLSPTQTDAQLAASGATCPYGNEPIYGVDHLNNIVAAGHAPIPAQSVVTESNVQQLSGLDPTTYLSKASVSIGQAPGFLFWGTQYGELSYLISPGSNVPITLDPSFATPYTRASTLGIQRQVGRDVVVSLDLYHKGIENILGVRQTNLPFAARINNSFVGTFVDGYGPWYSGKYNSAILSFEKRFTHRYTVGGSYAFTSEDDDALNSDLSTATGGNSFPTDSYIGQTTELTDPVTGQTNASGGFFASNGNYIPKAGIFWNGPKLDEGYSDFALRHILQLHGTVQIPFKIQFSGVYRVQSGYHYTATAAAAVDQDGNGNYGPRDLKTGRNQFVAPHYMDQDIRIARLFTIRDRFKVQPMFEFFNLFNSANPAAVQEQQAVKAPAPQPFQSVTQVLPGRQGQVALRIEF